MKPEFSSRLAATAPATALPPEVLQKGRAVQNWAERSTRMPSVDTSTPVLLLSVKTHGSLGVLRSLGRLGVPVYGMDSGARGPASYSRYCRHRFVWNYEAWSAEQSVECLLQVARQIGRRCVLIPTWDETAVFAAEQYNALKEWFVLPQQSPDLARSLTSKKEMYFLARRCGIPTAHTVFPESLHDAKEFSRNALFPVMLKGIDGNLLKARTGRKMLIAQSEKELLDAYRQMEDPNHPNLMIQEYIPGSDDTQWMFNGYFNESSECLFGVAGKKLRQTPVYTGATSLGICLTNETVEHTTVRWMKRLGYRGILDIGYRYDARDGQYKVLDVNPRIGATFRLFVAENGLDVARALYLDLTGQSVPLGAAREGRKWMVEKDFKSSIDYHRDGKLTFFEWLKSLKGIEEFGYFAVDDPLPFLSTCKFLFRSITDH